jgi:hypothetical protein
MKYTAKDIEVYICVGDYLTDPMDDSREPRQIGSFTVHNEENVTINLVDGGVMGLDEVDDDMILLESEVNV